MFCKMPLKLSVSDVFISHTDWGYCFSLLCFVLFLFFKERIHRRSMVFEVRENILFVDGNDPLEKGRLNDVGVERSKVRVMPSSGQEEIRFRTQGEETGLR